MGRRKKGIPGLTFSWKRALGVTKAKRKISKSTGVPLTRAGRRQKLARSAGCSLLLLESLGSLLTLCIFAVVRLP